MMLTRAWSATPSTSSSSRTASPPSCSFAAGCLGKWARQILALFGAIKTTASSASVLHHGIQDLLSITDGVLKLLEISLGKNSGLKYEQHHHEPFSFSPTAFSCSAL